MIRLNGTKLGLLYLPGITEIKAEIAKFKQLWVGH